MSKSDDAKQTIKDAQKQIEESRAKLRGERDRMKAEAMDILKEAQELTDLIGDTMDFSVAYGMGGDYSANRGWVSSSEMC